MLNLGIIGTNWITHEFVSAAIKSEEYQLKAVYSRQVEKAQEFASRYPNSEEMMYSTDLVDFFHLDDLDVIYIASPNSLHYEQAKGAIEAGKHVIVEKPAVSTLEELEELIDLAEEKEVFYFEAARHIHEENFERVALLLKNREDILGANLNFMKYSSRYDAVLKGEEPNIFSPKFSGGALMDLGVYLIYAAISWFGKPKESFYFDQKLPTGVDGLGTMIFRYDGFDVTMMTGKNADNYLPSEIYLGDSTICLDAVNSIQEIKVKKRDKGQLIELSYAEESLDNPMIEEAIAFSKVINNPMNVKEQKQYQDWIQLAKDVHSVMESLRKQAGIVFDADK
ncbi:MAG: Gfo/Idh/MocA family oxidoreductase [Vagococcus sp.]|uniref:Gfo/Idh/MocA family protein n=1 Tax=Vagococcus sp. TaxID=1933889 RepID=UPI002FC92143